MCFSAEASFSVGAVLIGVGACTWRAANEPRERAFAAIPMLFGMQQVIEGLLWLSFHRDMPHLGVTMTYAYSFFAQLFWPVYVPVAVLLIEPVAWRRQALRTCALIGLVVSAWLLYSLVAYGVVAQVVGQHIEYVSRPDLGPMTMLLYLVSTSACLLMSSHRTAKTFGALALMSFVIAQVAYTLWLISVWCYFSAFLSAIVLLHFRTGTVLAPQPRRL